MPTLEVGARRVETGAQGCGRRARFSAHAAAGSPEAPQAQEGNRGGGRGTVRRQGLVTIMLGSRVLI